MNLFREKGSWLRCALHAHTTNSDGELGPDMLVRHYEWAGYDVLAITDHWVRTAEPSTRKLLVIPSAELNANDTDLGSSSPVVLDAGHLAECGKDGQIRVSFRAREGVDAAALAARFGGGGHRAASGATLPGPLSDALRRVLEAAAEVTSDE